MSPLAPLHYGEGNKKSFVINISKALIGLSFLLLLLIASCMESRVVNKAKLTPTYTESYCFMEGFPAYGWYQVGNAIISVDSNENFMKYAALNDSTYAFTCGNGNKEFVIYKRKCSEGPYNYQLIHSEPMLMVLLEKSGSDTWENIYLNFRTKKMSREQSLYLDDESTWHVTWEPNNEDVFLIATNEYLDTRVKLKTKYYQIRKGGWPKFYLQDIYIEGVNLYYSVENEQGEIIADTLSLIE